MNLDRADGRAEGNKAEIQEGEAGRDSRRGFLSKSAAAASGLVLAGAGAAMANNNDILPSLYPGWNKRIFQEITFDEDSHVAFLIKALGTNARPMPTFKNLFTATHKQLAQLTLAFENTGVHAYLGALPYISDPFLAQTAGTIATVEARHAGWINSLLNQPLVPGEQPFDVPFTQQQVIQNIAPYVASVPGPALGFSTNFADRGPQNDVAILNFALALEYLEKTFYDLNVPRLF